MADTYKVLGQGQPTTGTAADLLAPASGHQFVVGRVTVANPTASDATVSFFVNGTADANCIIPPTTIPAGGSWQPDLQGMCFNGTASDTLKYKASAGTTLTVTVFGDDIS